MTDPTDLIAQTDAWIDGSGDIRPSLVDMAAALEAERAVTKVLEGARVRLAGALQPFADAADELDELGMDDPHQQAPVTYDDCAAARAALTGEPQP